MESNYVSSRLRRDLGRPCVLFDRDPEISLDLAPDRGLRARFLRPTPRHQATQTRCDMSEHQVNTKRVETQSRGMTHTEGGWPKNVDPNEIEQTIGYRKKLEKDEGFKNSIPQMENGMRHCIQQNNALDIYQKYFTDEDQSAERPSAKP